MILHTLHILDWKDPTNKAEWEAKVNEATSTYNNVHLSKFQLSIHRRNLGGAKRELLSYSMRFTFMGTLAPSSPATFGLGKIDGCLSIFVLGPLGNSKV